MIRRQTSPNVGIWLALGACLPIAGLLLVAPVLPQIAQAYAGTPGIEYLAPILLAIPGLMIALFSGVAGYMTDRIGRKRPLIAALVLYAVFGMAPLLLTSLPVIILTRALTGLMETVILLCTTTMIADYYSGSLRERYFSIQVLFGSLGAVIFVIVGGIAGSHGWRGPFWFYGISLLLLIPYCILLWEPKNEPDTLHSARPTIPWRSLGGICALTLLAAIGFYVVPVQIGFLAAQVGIHASQNIGLLAGSANVAVGVGAFLFVRFARLGTRLILTLSLLLMALSFGWISAAHSVPMLIGGIAINGIGCGAILPALLTWMTSGLAFEVRGRGTGVWQGVFWLGEFTSPLIVVTASKAMGGLSAAVLLFAAAFLVLAAGWFVFSGRRVSNASARG